MCQGADFLAANKDTHELGNVPHSNHIERRLHASGTGEYSWTNLQISVVHSTAMTIINCINKLVEVSSCFIFSQPPRIDLIIHSTKITEK
jgi:hypothetical protein